MESGDHQSVQGGRSASGVGLENTTRWNPTKEQISMLENLYVQGVRTPSAEQIQQITARLRAYGHIEGKNVFYWFQNHKARQRQRQKQEASLAHFNHFLRTTAAAAQYPLFPPPQYPDPNVVYSSYCVPPAPSEVGFYPPSHPKVPLQSVGFKRRPRIDKLDVPARTCSGGGGRGGSESMRHGYGGGGRCSVDVNDVTNKLTSNFDEQETLPLFPLTPTGILLGKDGSPSSEASQISSALVGSSGIVEGKANQPNFYDFFSGGQGVVTD